MISFAGLINFAAAVFLFIFGTFVMLSARNLVRKIIGMGIMQASVILFFITLGYKSNSIAPILHHSPIDPHEAVLFSNPLPHALMLTAIVVGASLLGVALMLLINIYRSCGSLEEDEILKKLGGLQ